jgi:hypothetical protein
VVPSIYMVVARKRAPVLEERPREPQVTPLAQAV